MGEPKVFDKNFVIAVALSALVWFAWQTWYEHNYPQAKVAIQKEEVKPQPVETAVQKVDAKINLPKLNEEKIVEFHGEKINFQLSSHGMGLKNIQLKDYKTRDDQSVVLLKENHTSFSTSLRDNELPLEFTISKKSENEFFGIAKVGNLTVEKTVRMRADGYSFDILLDINGANQIETVIGDQYKSLDSDEKKSTNEVHEWVLIANEKGTHHHIDPKSYNELKIDESSIEAAAFSSHYFTVAVLDQSPILGKFRKAEKTENDFAKGIIKHEKGGGAEDFKLAMVGYVGPKSYELLKGIHPTLPKLIDLGMFSIIAAPMLELLKFFYKYVGNWGVAIIALTLLVRILTLPFNIYAMTSMKALQKIQPQMNALKEKYKDDPKRMNQEVLQLMRTNKASPLGGCLPNLLQIPIFIALYQVFAQSIELYRSPFIFWIHDLSLKDPFYVLPVLMGASMYAQQKMMPNTSMDPAQAKVMAWMPVIFAGMMVTLPSGLTLYIFVSTLFGIAQQMIFMRDKQKTLLPKTA